MFRKNPLTPEVSVIMSIYREPIEWIKQSIDSILNQSFKDFEFIIINDDPVRKENFLLVSEYERKDNRIIFFNNKKNLGLTKSLNKGIEISQGNYIARMDADDISHKYRLEKQVEFLNKNKDIDLCGTWVKLLNGKGVIGKWRNASHPDRLFANLFWGNRISHPSVMFRKDVFVRNDFYYDESFPKTQDYALWTELSLAGHKLGNIPEFLLFYRVHGDQISNRSLVEQDFYLKKIRLKWLNYFVGKVNDVDLDVFHKICKYEKLDKFERDVYFSLMERLRKVIFSNKVRNKEYKKLLLRRRFFYMIRYFIF